MSGISYILAFKAAGDEDVGELASYLKTLSNHVSEVIVVNGSHDDLWTEHDRLWGSYCLHMRPRSDLRFANGKVDGVITGVESASCEVVVIADDDVRYDLPSLDRIVQLFTEADLVIPQNHFSEHPWHAAWDTGRTLLNRAVSYDYPGTLAVRREVFMSCGGYDGDVMFENLELIRTVEAAGGRVLAPLDLLVERRPPEAARFVSQRVRQAYDEFALPGRLLLFLSVLPGIGALVWLRRWRLLAGALVMPVAVAELGRRRGGGRRVYPRRASFLAPLWLLERGVCMWFAVIELLRGGIPYRGTRIRMAAHRTRTIANRLPYPWARSEP